MKWRLSLGRLSDALPTGVRRPKPEHLALLVFFAAIALRLYRDTPTWSSSDAADLADLVSWFVCHRPIRWASISELGTYRLGGVQPLVLYWQMQLVRLLDWRATEITWESTTIAVSAAGTYAAFLFLREVAGAAAGLTAAVLLAVSPLGISLGRHLGAPWAYEMFFQYLIALLLVTSMRRPGRANRIGLCLALAVYFWVGNQMLGIIPVLVYGVAAGFAERTENEGLVPFIRRRLTVWLAVPVASFTFLIYCTFWLRTGHLAHALFHKAHNLGFYYSQWLQDASTDVSAATVHISLALIVLGVLEERRWLSQRHLPVVLFLAYSTPFWTVIPPRSTLTRGYVMYGVSAMMVAAAAAAFLPRLRAVRAPLLMGIVGVVLMVATLASTYRLIDTDIVSVKRFQGAYTDNNGIKTAAGWIRSRGRAHGRVFSDASGGWGLEPSVVDMYTQRGTFGLFDGPTSRDVYARFSKDARRIEYLLVHPENRDLASSYFPAFAPALDVTDGERGVILSVYANKPVTSRDRVDVTEGDRLFRSKHSMMCTD